MGDAQSAPERLRARLRELGWTQLELASAVRASPANVSRWLSGERTPSLSMAFAIEREVGLPASSWVSHGADESGEHSAISSTGTEG